MANIDSPVDPEPRQLPGCGLAAFAMVLLLIFLIGISGVFFSTCTLLRSGAELTPQRLAYGGMVDPSMLAPLRQAGLIGPDEVPDAYHAENATGTEACAISGREVVRIGAGGPQSMPIASITSVTGSDTEVVIHGDASTDATLTCRFGPDEGGDRFRRMLDNR